MHEIVAFYANLSRIQTCLLWLLKRRELFASLLCNVDIKHFDKINSILKLMKLFKTFFVQTFFVSIFSNTIKIFYKAFFL